MGYTFPSSLLFASNYLLNNLEITALTHAVV